MRHKSNHILALECSDGHISAIRARAAQSGVHVVEQIVEAGDWTHADGSLQRHLIEVAEKHSFEENRIVLILPRHRATVRILELPSTDPDEIRGMVALSSVEWVPFNADEIVVSACILKTIDDTHSQVLAVVVPKTTIDEQLQMLKGAGLEPESIHLSTACMVAALSYPTPPTESALYFHQSGRVIETLALIDGGIAFSRGIECENSSPKTLGRAINENMGLCKRETGADTPKHLHLTQSVPSLDSSWNAIAAEVDGNISECSQAKRVVLQGIEHLSDVTLLELGAVLLAQADSPYAADLMPNAVTEQRERSSEKRTLLEYGAVFALLLILGIAAFGQTVQQQNTYLERLEEQAEMLRPEALRVAQKRKNLQRMQSQVTRVDTPLEHLARITLQAPDVGLTLSKYHYRYDDGITLHGRATNAAAFSGMIDRLRSVGRSVYPQLVQARELYRNERKERDQTVLDYAITIEFPEDALEVIQ